MLEQTSYYITQWSNRKLYKLLCWVKCWNRPVTISPILLRRIYISNDNVGEVLEQTSYYITQVYPCNLIHIVVRWSAGTDQLLYHRREINLYMVWFGQCGEVLEQTSYYITFPYSSELLELSEVKCWNRPVTISPVCGNFCSYSINKVKCWNRPVTISPSTVDIPWIPGAVGEVLEQTSYYIT